MKHCFCLIAFLLVACGKEVTQLEPKTESKAQAATAPPKPAPEKKVPPVPQCKLIKMDPEKAKFIAVPSTPKDPEIKKIEKAADKPKVEVKKVEKPATEMKKAGAPSALTNAAEQPAPEVKKAAPATDKQ